MEIPVSLLAKMILDILSSSSLNEKLSILLKKNKDPYKVALEGSLERAISLFYSFHQTDQRYKPFIEFGITENPSVIKELSKFLTLSDEPNFDTIKHWKIRDGIVDDFDLSVDEIDSAVQLFFGLVESELHKEPALREHFNSRALQKILVLQRQIKESQVVTHKNKQWSFSGSWKYPQIADINNHLLRQQLEKIVDLINIDYIDEGLFSLARLLETELKEALLLAKEKNVFTVSGRDLSNLAAMIDCAVSNSVLPNSDELHFLRKERNKRAHGKPPELIEREKLMRWAGFLGDLYIDQIILIRKYQDNLSNVI